MGYYQQQQQQSIPRNLAFTWHDGDQTKRFQQRRSPSSATIYRPVLRQSTVTPSLHADISLSRRDKVLLAQLRSDHTTVINFCKVVLQRQLNATLIIFVNNNNNNNKLAAYHNVIGSSLSKMQLGISHTRTLVTGVSGHSKQNNFKSSEKPIHHTSSVYPGHQSARGDPVRAGNSPVTWDRRTKARFPLPELTARVDG